MTTSKFDPLDELFAQAAQTPEAVSDDLMARVLADALAAQPVPAPIAQPVRPSFWSRLLDGLGGWPSFAGLTTAAVAGIWIGVDTPDIANGVMSLYFETGTDVIFVDAALGWDAVFEDSEI
jgi:hypothetical protein